MTVRTALVTTLKPLRELAAERADRQAPQPRGPRDRFDQRPPPQDHGSGGLGDADSGGGDPKGGTQIGWQR